MLVQRGEQMDKETGTNYRSHEYKKVWGLDGFHFDFSSATSELEATDYTQLALTSSKSAMVTPE